ncbi:hypothetical protein [Halocalculus aciditolerans]|nr:hypothetical protein [Halocalculus aciditolerans]
MATRGTTEGAGRPSADALPVDGRALSFALGDRLTAAETPVAAFDHAASPGGIRLYPATEHTRILALRSPVGHRRFYEVDDGVEDALDDADDWQRA